MGPCEKEDLFCARLTNARKLLERFLGLGNGQREHGAQITLEFLQDDLRTGAQLFGKLFRDDAVSRHIEDCVLRSRQYPLRLRADALLESLEGFVSSIVVGKI